MMNLLDRKTEFDSILSHFCHHRYNTGFLRHECWALNELPFPQGIR